MPLEVSPSNKNANNALAMEMLMADPVILGEPSDFAKIEARWRWFPAVLPTFLIEEERASWPLESTQGVARLPWAFHSSCQWYSKL